MAQDTAQSTAEARELSLVGNVEFRVALADTDEKLENLLQKYLAPLLLKLASDSLAVRNKVIAVCQHINKRITPQSIQLPVPALLKQFKEQQSQLIRHFDLIYIQQGIDRINSTARVELLPNVLQDIATLKNEPAQAATVFNLTLRLLPLLKIPPKDSPEDVKLGEKLCLSKADTEYLSFWFSKLLLLPLGAKDEASCPGLSPSEFRFLHRDSTPEEVWNPSKNAGMNFIETKIAVLQFLASGAFANDERFLPAVIASADANSRLVDLGEDILKRFNPDLENAQVVEQLYTLYFGTTGDDPTPPVQTPLKIKILSLLGRSVLATRYTDNVIRLLDQGLFSDTAKSAQGLQASKLRSQIFVFTTWLVRMGDPSDLRKIAPQAVSGLRDFIVSQGWPNPGATGIKLSTADVSLRGQAYESIGILAAKAERERRSDDADKFDLDLLFWLFNSLSSDASSSQVSVSIEQALGSVLNSSPQISDEKVRHELCQFLIAHMRLRPDHVNPFTGSDVVRPSRYAAVRFANRCLYYQDIYARFIDILAIGAESDGDRETVEEGRKGLNPYWFRMINPGLNWASDSAHLHDNPRYKFPTFSSMVIPMKLLQDLETKESDRTKLNGSLAATVDFARQLIIWEALKSQIAVDIDQQWEHRLDTLISTDESARLALQDYIRLSEPETTSFFLSFAVNELKANGKEAASCGAHFVQISSLSANEVLVKVAPDADSLLDRLLSNDSAVQNISARAFGILASHPAFPTDNLLRLVEELSGQLLGWRGAFGQLANRVRGSLLALAYLLSRIAYRQRVDILPSSGVEKYVKTMLDILVETRDSQLREAAEITLGQLSLSGIITAAKLFEISEWKAIREKLVESAKKERESSIAALGRLSLIMPKDTEKSPFSEILEHLYELHEIRKSEVQFAVGESLSIAAAGWKSKSLIEDFDVDAPPLRTDIPDNILGDMADKFIEGCGASKPSLRKASAIWLLSLVKDCGHMHEIQTRLRRCQQAFTSLLADRDEVVQESGSRGLSLVYEMGDSSLKDDLVHDLVQSFTGSNARLGGRISEDTELFEPGALPTGEGSSITTYKDIMNLASEVGDPSLVYRFMSLASNNAIWSSRAAFGRFGLSSVLSDSSVNGYLSRNPKIYPKLYRYRFDPNTNVQRSMNDIWQAMVKDPNEVLDSHFDDIVQDLLKSIVAGREWRVRQASCDAIADLIQGRPVEKYDKYMNEILTKAFKVLDDIKESVRKAALRLCQVITNMLIRTLETGDTGSKRANTMLRHIVPFLLSKEGMESSAQEIQGYAISTLIKIIQKSPAAMLRPFSPQILEKFLSSLSSLEPQAVNYIHLNADKYGLTGQEIDNMRLSSIRMSPMMESIERYLLDGLDEASMKEVASRIEGALRSAVGLPSKVGCSRVLVILSTKSQLFRPYADRFIQLLKKYVLDRNDTVSVSYSTSIGYLIRLASDDRVLDTIEFAKTLYFTSEDVSHRAVAGEIMHSMSKLSSDRFSAFASAALPFVFVAKHDTNEQVRESFEKTWQDNVGGSRAVILYLQEILSIISQHIDSPRWSTKHTASLATADAATSLGKAVDEPTGTALWPVLEKALSGKTWEGKEVVLQAFVSFTDSAKATWMKHPDVGEQMKVIALREAKRNNQQYRPHGLNALGEFAEVRTDLNLVPDALRIVSSVVEEMASPSDDKMDIDSGNLAKDSESDNTLAACVNCVFRCVTPRINGSTFEMKEYVGKMIPLVEDALKGGGRRVHETLFTRMKSFFSRIEKETASTAGGSLRELDESIRELADRLLFRDLDLSIEASRALRAQATEEYITACKRGGFGVSEKAALCLNAWLKVERAGPVKRILSGALRQLEEGLH